MSHGIKILFVDDEIELTEIMKSFLQSRGYQVKCAFNGREGLEMTRAEKPDVILLDVMMPEMNGFQMCQLIKADRALRRIPIIYVTALNPGLDSNLTSSLGADGFISKPFDRQFLLDEINRAVAPN